MAGKSNQEKEAERLISDQRSLQNEIKGGKYNVTNPFTDYKSPFDYKDISGNIESIFKTQENNINKSSADAVAEAQGNAVSSLASRGITGGSAVDTITSGVASKVNKAKSDAMSKLGTDKSSMIADLMKYFDNTDLNVKKAGVDVDLSNISNILGGLTNSTRNQSALLGGLDNTTWLDDLLGLVKTGTKAAGDVLTIPGIL